MVEQRKPYDVGNGLVCASFGVDGSWLSVGMPHPQVGLVELTGAPAFPPEHDGHVELVRAHRASLTSPALAALQVEGGHADPPGGEPEWRIHGEGWEAKATAWAEPVLPTVVQEYSLESGDAGALRLVFRGHMNRPAYAEITPGGPIPPLLPPDEISEDGSTLRLRTPLGENPALALVEVTSPDLHVGSWETTGDGGTLAVSWDRAVDEALLVVRITMSCGEPRKSPRHPDWMAALPSTSEGSVLHRIQAAALRYTMCCTALEVGEDACCIITDHRLLPLSWTRDAYYQAALLLAHAQDLPEAVGVVERHLTWLWRYGRDTDRVWRRSHFTTGVVKDTAYQVDQQLFPLLELADFRRATNAWPGGSPEPWGIEVRRIWRDLPRDENGLVPGEENPADDPSAFPYLLSSQLLLAYVARRVAEIEKELGLEDLRLQEDAERTLDSIESTFTCPGPFGDQWAYEADGSGGHRLYHDANDVPTALAPLWGLCEPTDPRWRATMQFAFSESNPGFVAGGVGGLGSAHTPGVWPLGDAQQWVVAALLGDASSAQRAVERLGNVVSADGMLPETYDPRTGEWLARHWFAWPGSLVGLLHATLHHGRGPWAVQHS